MSKRAILVMGAVSSGTRMLTRLFVAAGCNGDGNKDHTQRWDTEQPHGDLIVWRRHVPTRRTPKWAIHENAIYALQSLGYDVHAVIIVRDWFPTVQSALKANHRPNKAAVEEMNREVWRLMFRDLPSDVPFTVVTYESLIQRPQQAFYALCDHLGIERPSSFEAIEDGNEKHFQQVAL